MSTDYDSLSYVISSHYRKLVVEALAENPRTPSQISNGHSEEPGIAHVSRALQGLKEQELVDLLVSEDRKKGRVYGLTEKGRSVLEQGRETDMLAAPAATDGGEHE